MSPTTEPSVRSVDTFALGPLPNARLRAAVGALAPALGMGRVRAIVRDILPSRLSETEVRKRLPNEALAATELAAALENPSLRARALAVLAALTTEAWGSHSVDDRVGTAFRRARTALDAVDMVRYQRELAVLDGLAITMPSDILEHRHVLLALASRSGERVLNALQGTVSIPTAHSEKALILPAPVAMPASGGTTAGGAPTTLAPFSKALPPAVDHPVKSAVPTPASDVPAAMMPLLDRLSEIRRDVELASRDAEVPIPSAADAGKLWQTPITEAIEALKVATEAVGVGGALTALAAAAKAAAVDVEHLVTSANAERDLARVQLANLCGKTSSTELCASIEACSGEIAKLPHDTSHVGGLELLSGLGPVDERLVNLRTWVKEILEETEKKNRILALEREIVALRGGRDGTYSSDALPRPPVPSLVEQIRVIEAFPESSQSVPTLAFARVNSFPLTFPRGGFLCNVKTGSAHVATHFLPVDREAGVIPAKGSSAERLNAAAGWIIRVCAEDVMAGNAPLSNYLSIIDDAALLLRESRDPVASKTFLLSVVGTLLLPASDLSPRARRRHATALVGSGDMATIQTAFFEALGAADQPALVPVLARLLALRLYDEVVFLSVAVQKDKPAACRGWADALGVAIETLPAVERDALFELLFKAAGLGNPERSQVENWLDSVGPKRTQRPLDVDLPTWLVDTLHAFATCEYETSERGEASVNASVPGTVKDAGLHIAPGAERTVLPVLVRNAGGRGAAAVEVRLAATAGGGCTLPVDGRHAYVRWIGREMDPPQDAIFEVPVDLSADAITKVIKVNAYVRWAGSSKESSKDLVYTVVDTPLVPARANLPAEGVRGTPLDLNDPKVLARSSRSVKDCLRSLSSALREGQSVRAMVYGRRRRGKSSIRRTIASDAVIAQHFLVRENTWNSSPMASMRFALDHLARLIRDALLARNENVAEFLPREGASRDELAAAWQEWMDTVSRGLKVQARVLLLLDEFQKWLSGLSDKADRLALLNVFRAFNDASGARLDVTFVLFGLQNLLRFQKESIDFAAAVKGWQIKPLTLEESKRYVQECLPQAHDERVRRRLHVLCGGNPFVLNIFCQQLADRANEHLRGYCIPSDVEALLERFVDDRVEAVFTYMLREDEEENAPSLTQLTVLRAVASALHETGSHESWVRTEEVEQWLSRKAVPYDAGLPSEHLLQLVDLGVLERHADGRRFGLQGEAICRWLAGQDDQRVPLQPVRLQRDVNLVLGRFRQIKQIAEGGQATTWLAENVEEGGHHVVLKIYRDAGGDIRERIEREGEMLKRVRSPYVIACQSHSVDERKGGVLVLEWVDGPTLFDVIRDHPPAAASILPGGQLVAQIELFKKIATGVAAVHSARVVHKDLKPQNILVVEASGVFVPKIIDFGIAGEEAGAGAGATQSVFTWRYLAPEKRKDASVTRGRPADVYSLGMVFLDLIVGLKQTEDAAGLLTLLPTNIPGKLRRLLEEMVAEEPMSRPTAEIVRSRLEGVLEAGGWTELVQQAQAAYVESRFDEATHYYERALAEALIAERYSTEFATVVEDIFSLLSEYPTQIRWWDVLIDAGLDVLTMVRDVATCSNQIFACIQNGVGDSTSGTSRWDCLLDALERREAPHATWAALLRLMIADLGAVRRHGDRLFEVVNRFRECEILTTAEIADFCAVAAGAARRVAAPMGVIETWLRRGRRVHRKPTDLLAAEIKAFEAIQQKTQATAGLPPDCNEQDMTVVGTAERGHIDVQRIERFAHRLLKMHSYVCAVKRKRKDGDLPASAPRLLEEDNIAQHKMDGIDDSRLIPFALDGSYTVDAVTIRMNIVLPKGTTASQRKMARDAIVANKQLFP